MTIVDLVAALSFPIIERIPLFGDAAISPHGIGIAVGFGLGAVLMVRRAEKRGLGHVHEPDISQSVQELLTRAAIGAIVGARGFYVLTHLSEFSSEPWRVLFAWEGGLTFLGGVTGAVLFAIPFARQRRWRMSMLLDSAAPGIALGLGVGRIGDLMIGDHIGAPTDFALAWRCTGNYWVRATNSFGEVSPLPYPTTFEPTAGCFDVAVHHTALYDFGATVIVLLVLLAMERRSWFDGAFIAAWVYVYGALRFTSDFARQDKQILLGLTGSQLALLSAAAGVTLLLLRSRPWDRPHRAWDLVFDHPWKREGFESATLTPTGGATASADEHSPVSPDPDPPLEPEPEAVPDPPLESEPEPEAVPEPETEPGPVTGTGPAAEPGQRPTEPNPATDPADAPDELPRPPRPWGDGPRMASRPRKRGDSGA